MTPTSILALGLLVLWTANTTLFADSQTRAGASDGETLHVRLITTERKLPKRWTLKTDAGTRHDAVHLAPTRIGPSLAIQIQEQATLQADPFSVTVHRSRLHKSPAGKTLLLIERCAEKPGQLRSIAFPDRLEALATGDYWILNASAKALRFKSNEADQWDLPPGGQCSLHPSEGSDRFPVAVGYTEGKPVLQSEWFVLPGQITLVAIEAVPASRDNLRFHAFTYFPPVPE